MITAIFNNVFGGAVATNATEMTPDDRKRIREIQATLIRIDRGERFFFNITQYINLGLVKERDIYGTDSSGNRVRIRSEYYLTDKAKQYIKIAV